VLASLSGLPLLQLSSSETDPDDLHQALPSHARNFCAKQHFPKEHRLSILVPLGERKRSPKLEPTSVKSGESGGESTVFQFWYHWVNINTARLKPSTAPGNAKLEPSYGQWLRN